MARTGDKVQVVSAVSAMQSTRHETHGTDGIASRPCKERKDGAPTFRIGNARRSAKGGPPAQYANAAEEEFGTPGQQLVNGVEMEKANAPSTPDEAAPGPD